MNFADSILAPPATVWCVIRFDRRALLGRALLGAAAAGVLTGCSVTDPVIVGGPSAPPTTPTRTPTPRLLGADQAYALETALASQAAHLATAKLPAAQRQRIELVRDAHHAHAVALAGPRPTTRPTTVPTPAPTAAPTRLPGLGSTPAAAIKTLQGQERTAATGYAATAVASTGATALLWGSLAAAAQMAADAIALTSAVPAPRPAASRAPLAVVTDTDAAAALLTQVHAVVFGYRAGIAALSGTALQHADADLWRQQRLRDDLAALLAARGVTAPTALPAYALPVDPTTAATASSLFCTLEQRLLPYCGQWLAAADNTSRPDAQTTLTAGARASVAWGGAPLTWPGWPD